VTLLAEETHTASPDETVPYVLGTVPVSTTAGVTTGSVTTQLPPGQFELSAIYNGDSSSLMSAAMFQPFVVQNVAQPTTTTTLQSSPGSPVFGNAVTLTATVTPSQTGGANPTGSVRFGLGSSQFALGEVPVVTANGKTTATLTTTALPEGANTVYAVYSGDYDYGTSPLASTTVTEGTPTAPTHVTVTGPSTVAPGAAYSATATTDGTGAVRYSLAATPAPPQGMTIDADGAVAYNVPANGPVGFSYAVVAANAAGRAQSSLVTVAVAEIRAGADCRAIFDGTCLIFEAAGEPTQRTKKPGETLADGFFHGLGHGVGLEVHEAPGLGRLADKALVAGDVVTVEPGLYRAGYGGVRLEDIVLVTDDGAEVITDYPYELEP
jgi:hypothetical protein